MKKPFFFIVSFLAAISLANAQWQQTNGPFYSHISSIAVSGTNIFAGPNTGVVYLSADTGKTWNATNMPITFSMDVDDSAIYTVIDNLLYVSKDTGATYTTISTGLPDGCNAYLVDVTGDNIFVHTENNGTVLSQDDGASWTPVSLGYNVSSFMQYGDSIFAGTGSGVQISADSGMTWSIIGLEEKNVTSLLTNGTWILAGTSANGIYMSDDKGATWKPSDTGITDSCITSLILHGTDIFAGTFSGGVFVSTNDALNWELAGSGFPDGSYIRCLASYNNNIFAGTSSTGIFITSNNGALWTHSGTGLGEPADVNSLAVKGDNLIAGTSLSGIFTSGNYGTDWNLSDIAHGIYTFVEEGNTIYAGTTNGLYQSDDDGTSWEQAGLPGTWITAVAIADNTIFVGTEQGVFLSENNGINWTEANNGIPDHTHIYSLAVKETCLFAGSFDSGIYLSTDYGLSWTNVSTGIPYSFVRSLFVDGENIYAGVWWNGIYRSTDNGTSWNSAGLEDAGVTSFVKNGNCLFAGTWQDGVFVSCDQGLNWTEINTGLTNLVTVSLALDENYLYAGIGNAGGVWKRPLSEIVDILTMNENTGIKLYPNPAKNELFVEDNRPDSDGMISVFNLEGQLIVSEKLINSGIKIEISDLSSGIYLLKISNRNKTEVIKFIKE
jgi:hypothetical protein